MGITTMVNPAFCNDAIVRVPSFSITYHGWDGVDRWMTSVVTSDNPGAGKQVAAVRYVGTLPVSGVYVGAINATTFIIDNLVAGAANNIHVWAQTAGGGNKGP